MSVATESWTNTDFVFRVNKVHKDPLSRELHEAVLIKKIREEEWILNSKSEWNKTSLSRLCIEKEDWEIKKEIAANEQCDATEKNPNQIVQRYQKNC